MVPFKVIVCTCLVIGRLLAPAAARAAHCAAECSTASHSHTYRTQSSDLDSCLCTTFDRVGNTAFKTSPRSSDSPVLTSGTKAQGTSGSSDILTTLSLVVLVNNLMPVFIPARWGLATTAVAWLWLAFSRLLPWLPQSSPPSHAATAATPASRSDAVAAAAGLSPAATAASAAGGVGGDLSTRWWQHALLFLELGMGNAVDAVLLMGLMLLPVLVLRRWLAGKKLWHAVPGLSTARLGESQGTPTAAAPTAASDAPGMAATDWTGDAADNAAARSSVDGLSMQLQNAGDSAAALAKAMRNIGRSDARSASDSDSDLDSTSSRGSGHHAEGRAHSSGSSSTASMVSPQQSRLQPATPPLTGAVRPDGALAMSASGSRLAGPLHSPPTPTSSTCASAAHVQVVQPEVQLHASHSAKQPSAVPQASSTFGSSDDISAAAGSVTLVTPADSTSQQQGCAAAPSGSHADSGSSEGDGVSLNLGAIGTIRTLSTRSPQPMYPTRALYNSPLETVVVSCKLAASRNSTVQLARTTAYVGPSTAAETGSAAGATVQVPLSPAQASLASGGHGSSVSAQRELRAVVEAAVRQAVAASNVAVLSTTVTSFPGCVHVVATANLTAAALEAAAQSGSEAAGTAEGVEAGWLTAQVVWEQVVRQILSVQQDANSSDSPDGSSCISHSNGVQDPARIPASRGLYLKHLLVQDLAGNIHYLWIAPEAGSSAEDVGPAATDVASAAAQSSSVYSASPQPASPASSSSSRSMCASIKGATRIQQILSAANGISISSFALPTDTAGVLDAPASNLLLPQVLADALRAAGCGLRVVISADPHGADAAAAGHLLADHTMWPNSSSWQVGAEFDIGQLLPAGVPAAALLQQFGPVLTVNIVASTGAAGAVTAERRGAGLGEGTVLAGSADVVPVQDEGEAAVRSPSGKLHQEIARFVRRLHKGPGGEQQAPPGSSLSTDAVTSVTPGTGTAGQQQGPEHGDVGEYLLLQLPLLLLPSAACMELNQLQQRMAEELFGDAVTAARRHVLPLVNDIAAAFSMHSAAAATDTSTVSTAPEQGPGRQLRTKQKHLMKQLLQYMSDQSLDALAAAVCSYVGLHDVGSLTQLQEPATAAQHMVGLQELEPAVDTVRDDAAPAPATGQPASQSNSSAGVSASSEAAARLAQDRESQSLNSKQAAKALEQASAAREQATAAQRAAAATESALQLALQQISALSAAAAQASRQAAEAEAAAAAATQRAAAVEEQAEHQRAMQLIGAPAGTAGRGVGIFGLFGGSSWAVSAARSAGTALLGGVMRATEPPLVPQDVTSRDVLMGFRDERLEVQYRRMKALQCRSIDRAALLMQLFRQVVYVWRIARLMYVSAGTGLSLVLLCKYEAVVLLPYMMMMLTPDFYIYHRHLLLCLSQLAAAATVGMIATTEVYRNEWSALLQRPGPTILARPSMMLFWYYILVPILQQQTMPEQGITCAAQLVHSLLIYLYILKGTTSLFLVVPLLLAASGVSFGLTYMADAWTRRQAVAGVRRSLTGAAN